MTTTKDSFLIRPRTRHFDQRVEARAGELLDQFIARAKWVPEHGTAERRQLRERADIDVQYQLARSLYDLERRLRPGLGPEHTDTLNVHVHALGELLGVRILYSQAPNASAAAVARIGRDEAQIPFVGSDADYATALHELGHIVEGPCTGPDHHGLRVGPSRYCLACETNAWRTAMRLSMEWTHAMRQHMRQCLDSYRSTTPAPAEAFLSLERACSEMGIQERRVRRLQRDTWYEQDAHARKITPWRFEDTRR